MIPKSDSTSGIRSSACDCLFGIVFVATLALLICAAPTILRLLILLQPTLPHFNLHSSSLANINTSSSSSSLTTANWHLVLSLRNPNRNPISYHGILATSLNNNISSTLSIPSFVHKGNNVQQELRVAFSNTSLHFTNSSSNGSNYNASCGALNLTMELQAGAEYGGWTWPIKTDTIKVVCRLDVEVQFPLIISSTSLNFDSSNSGCDVSGGWKTLVTNWNSLFWKYLYFVIVFLGILAVSL